MSARILLVTLDGPAGEAVQSVLGGGGAALDVARDQASAVRAAGGHELVIVDAADQSALVRLCRALRTGPPGSLPLLLAITDSPDVEDRVRLLGAGADDVLVQPFDPGELEALLDALLARGGMSYRRRQDGGSGEAEEAGTRPRLVVFAAAKGGVGSTTLAVNAAVALAGQRPGDVALVDLDFHHGQVATFLEVRAPATTAEIALDEQLLADGPGLRAAGVAHASGLRIYAAPTRPDAGLSVEPRQALAVTKAMRAAFELVVVDAGTVLDWRALALLEAADRRILTLTPEIPSLRLLHGALEVIAETATEAEEPLFVLNNIFPRQRVTAAQIQEHLGTRIALEVPYDSEAFITAANEGQPLVLSAPQSPAAQAIRRLAELLGGAAIPEAPAAVRRRMLGGLLKRG